MLKRFVSQIPAHIRLLFKLYGLNLVLFFFVRLFFYYVNQSNDVGNVSVSEKLLAFKRGVEFDTSVFCWIAFLPVLLWSLASVFNFSKLYAIGFYGFLILQLLYYFVASANIPYFHQFGTHLNKNAFLWNENPTFAAGIIFGSFSYWGYFILFFILAFVLIKPAVNFFKTFNTQNNYPLKWHAALIWFIVLSAFTVIGARGRVLERSGLQEGMGIVSQNSFINQIAINPNFTFWKSVIFSDEKKLYEAPKNIHESIAYARNYLDINSPYEENISRTIKDSLTPHNYNFVIVVMESMCRFKMGYYNGKNLTPHLNQLNKESVFCENFFSSGIHTFNGLFSTTTGYPSIYAEQPMKSYLKKPFDGIGTLLHQQGYETYFYTTHDANFDNMQGFFTLNHFEHFISETDFDYSQRESALGVPDHLLFDKLIETTNQRKSDKPFLQVVMTASDHGPWKIPTNIPFTPNGENPQDNCTLYADWSIGRFMEQVKKTSWYNNTVFIFLGDHGLSMGHTYEMPLSYHHVPCIIHQPSLFKTDTIFAPCYQPDIPATVMGIIGAKCNNNTFGINILKEQHPYVVFSADDKIGCINNNGFYYYKTLSNGETYLRKYKKLDPTNYKTSLKTKADSMEKNMMHIYETAEYFIQKNYFLYE